MSKYDEIVAEITCVLNRHKTTHTGGDLVWRGASTWNEIPIEAGSWMSDYIEDACWQGYVLWRG